MDLPEGAPAEFVTNWLDRVAFMSPCSIDDRVITTVYAIAANPGSAVDGD